MTEATPKAPFRPRLRPLPLVTLGVAVAFVCIFPFVGALNQIFLWEFVAIQVLFTISVNLLIGFANMPSFGQAAFYGIGAYTVAMVFPHGPAIPALVIAGLAGAAGALLLGFVAVRTRGIAFAMVTLAVEEGLYLLVYQAPTFGGENGIPDVAARGFSGTGYWFLLMAFVALAVVGYYIVVRSSFGYALRAVRDDPKRADFLGINPYWRRLTAFVLAGFGAGLAGGLLAYATGIVTPDMLYWTQAAYPVIMAILGGASTFWGPAFGAVGFTLILQKLGDITPAFLLPVGLILLFVILVVPEGLAGIIPWLQRRLRFGSHP